tara:strand:- start:172 stop:363 length:192 start_codon:yes stop_codon:yes gene_type:complete
MPDTKTYTVTLYNGKSFDKEMLSTSVERLWDELAQDIEDGDFNDSCWKNIDMNDVVSIELKQQ